LLCAKLRRSNIDAGAGAVEEIGRLVAQIRERWPNVKVVLRADSFFAREALMAWCEANTVDYVFGLARNARLLGTHRRRVGRSAAPVAGERRPAGAGVSRL